MENKDYNSDYNCRSRSDIINDICKDELLTIMKSHYINYDHETDDVIDGKQKAINKIFDDKSTEINIAIDKDKERVLKNMLSIPINSTVRISPTELVKRVPNGWIYLTEIYNGNIYPSVINMVTTFVPE